MRTITVGGEKQRLPETEREIAGQNIAAASKSLRTALAMRNLNPEALSDIETLEVARLVRSTADLAAMLGYEVRS